MAIGYLARDGVCHLTPRVQFSDADLARFQADLRRPNYESSLRRALAGERVMRKDAFGFSNEIRPALFSLTRGQDYALYSEIIGRLQDSLEHPWPQPLVQWQQVQAEMKARMGASGPSKMQYFASRGLLPLLRVNIEATARQTALNAAADAALAAERFRRRQGRPPETLEELVPQWLPSVPLDPYTGGVQRMLKTGDGIIIYSVGLDGVDNGGTGDDRGKPDVVFELKWGKSL
jgi:hypothetical protein